MKQQSLILPQIGGLVLSAYMIHIGVDLLVGEIKAEGTVSIQTFFGGGTLTSGNSGLFLVFFAFFLALASLLISSREEKSQTVPDSFQKTFRIFIIILFSSFFSFLFFVHWTGFGRESTGHILYCRRMSRNSTLDLDVCDFKCHF